MVALGGVSVSGLWRFIEDVISVPEEEWGTEEFEKTEIKAPTKNVIMEIVDPWEAPSGDPKPSTSAP